MKKKKIFFEIIEAKEEEEGKSCVCVCVSLLSADITTRCAASKRRIDEILFFSVKFSLTSPIEMRNRRETLSKKIFPKENSTQNYFVAKGKAEVTSVGSSWLIDVNDESYGQNRTRFSSKTNERVHWRSNNHGDASDKIKMRSLSLHFASISDLFTIALLCSRVQYGTTWSWSVDSSDLERRKVVRLSERSASAEFHRVDRTLQMHNATEVSVERKNGGAPIDEPSLSATSIGNAELYNFAFRWIFFRSETNEQFTVDSRTSTGNVVCDDQRRSGEYQQSRTTIRQSNHRFPAESRFEKVKSNDENSSTLFSADLRRRFRRKSFECVRPFSPNYWKCRTFARFDKFSSPFWSFSFCKWRWPICSRTAREWRKRDLATTFFSPSSVDFRFDVIRWNFSNFSACIRLWLLMFSSTCSIVYYSFHFWSYKRLSLIPLESASTEKPRKKPTSLRKKKNISRENSTFVFSSFRLVLSSRLLRIHRLVPLLSCSLHPRRKLSDRHANHRADRTGSIPDEIARLRSGKFASRDSLRSNLFERK